MPDLIGGENIERLKDQKDELDELRMEIEYFEKQKAVFQVQTDVLRQEYLKQYKKKEEFKHEVINMKKKNIKLDRKIMDL